VHQRYLYCNFAALIRKQCRARSLQRDYNDEGRKSEMDISLRDELDGMLQRIRTGRNIQTPIITCRRSVGIDTRSCHFGRNRTTIFRKPGSLCVARRHFRKSPHQLILALGRFGIASKDQTRALEKAWAEYRNNTGWTSKEKSPRGSREPVHIDDRGKGGSFARIRRMCKSRTRWTAEA